MDDIELGVLFLLNSCILVFNMLTMKCLFVIIYSNKDLSIVV